MTASAPHPRALARRLSGQLAWLLEILLWSLAGTQALRLLLS